MKACNELFLFFYKKNREDEINVQVDVPLHFMYTRDADYKIIMMYIIIS